MQFTEDLIEGEHTIPEVIVRASVVGAEDMVTDFAATVGGLLVASEGVMCGPAAPGCMAAGYVTGAYGTDLVLSRVFDIANDTQIFPRISDAFDSQNDF